MYVTFKQTSKMADLGLPQPLFPSPNSDTSTLLLLLGKSMYYHECTKLVPYFGCYFDFFITVDATVVQL